MGSQAILERNLSLLRKRNPQLASELESATCGEVEEVIGPRGANVLREQGILLGSAYDPEREAEKMAETMASNPADIMVAIGFGLGGQFTSYCERNPGTVIIYEPSISRLRAALSRLSIVDLFAMRRDLYITTDLEQFTRLLDARYFPGLRIQVFPHPAVLRLDPTAVNRAIERTRRVKEGCDTGTVTAIEQMMPWAKIVAANGERIVSRPSFGALAGKFKDQPVVIVAAGPSLDKQLPALKEMQDRVLIIAIGQTVKALVKAGIRPHLVHVLESRNVSHQLTDAGDSREINLVVSPDCHSEIFDVPVRSCFVVTTTMSPMGGWIERVRGNARFTISGGTVAQGAVGLAHMLGASPIMLIGQDLAFTDGRAYAQNSAYDFVDVKISDDSKFTFTNGKRKVALLGDRDLDTVADSRPLTELIWVDGWHEGERVATGRAYASFIEQYRTMAHHLAISGIRLVNCTEGGARIPEIEHVPFREMLDEVANEPIDAHRRIEEIHAAAPKFERMDFEEELVRSRRLLDRIERESKKALHFVGRCESSIVGAKNSQQAVDMLRRLARHEKKLRRQLARIPWLDALLQPEIYAAMTASRRSERMDPTIEELLEESRFLFEAAGRGVARARVWFDDFEASFDTDEENAPKPSRKGRGDDFGKPPLAGLCP